MHQYFDIFFFLFCIIFPFDTECEWTLWYWNAVVNTSFSYSGGVWPFNFSFKSEGGWCLQSVRLTICTFIQCVASGCAYRSEDSTGVTGCSSRAGRGAKKPGGSFSSSSYTVWSSFSEPESVNPRTSSPQTTSCTSGMQRVFSVLKYDHPVVPENT